MGGGGGEEGVKAESEGNVCCEIKLPTCSWKRSCLPDLN